MAEIAPERFARIELLLLDVDGVLTDGRICYTDDGREAKFFHVRDGSGLKYWRQSKKRVAIVSGRTSPAVNRRAAELGIDLVMQGVDEKLVALRRILKTTGLAPAQVCAIGDDLPDLPVMQAAGLSVAVADAATDVRAMANFVTQAVGGRGAVREAIEWLMRGQGTWSAIVNELARQRL